MPKPRMTVTFTESELREVYSVIVAQRPYRGFQLMRCNHILNKLDMACDAAKVVRPYATVKVMRLYSGADV